MAGTTLVEKIWREHLVDQRPDRPNLLYVDLHLVHEVSSPQAFDGLRASGRGVRRPELTLATEDHIVPTTDLGLPIADPRARTQVEALRANCAQFGITLHRFGAAGQGIVHVIGPELGLTQPGMVIVCGDSHTATHGAFGALAFGIGTSEVEHVLATQTVPQMMPLRMAVEVEGQLQPDATAKDLILALISQESVSGGKGHAVEYRGAAISALSMEGRMTICNMSIEWGAKAGLISPDQVTFDYLRGRSAAPPSRVWDKAEEYWSGFVSDIDAEFDKVVRLDASKVGPYVTWGTNPGQAVPIAAAVPDPSDLANAQQQQAAARALDYMALVPGTQMRDLAIDAVFIGSCTNGRIEDLRAAAAVLRGRRVASTTRMLVVPGSMRVRLQAESEGLDRIFTAAGAQWRASGCSLCLGMNSDRLAPGERCASTSNRNFEGRQGAGGRTHLVSPAVAAASGVLGHLAAPADLGGS